ncbi:MAG: proton-conducting transporter membrane subunit [Chloroflexota bacterium]|nr:proton-conducting transporter membrane subunit [Chloroflexota bacterium]MDE2947594.1 proton-conducting transporter membrane subunit [Chloroflexota bacterium]
MGNNYFLLGALVTPLVGAIVALVFARSNRIQRIIGVVAGIIAWVFCSALLIEIHSSGIQTYALGNWRPPYGIVLVADTFGGLFAFMVTSIMIGGLLYTLHSHDKCMTYPAFMPLFLLMEVGLVGAMLTGDLFTLFVFMELMVLASVSLTAISDDQYGLEAALKYILISSMGTLFLLLGIAAMYATFGTLNMAEIAQTLLTGERPFLAPASAIMLLCAFLLKSAVFPFHFWQPDFHTTAPTPISAMLSSIVVKVGVYGIIRLVTLLFIEEAPLLERWLSTLGIIGIVFGSLGALRTYNAKRMLAYSTFAQIGFILVGIGWGEPLALIGAIVYAFNHAFIKSSLLMLMGVVSSYTKIKSANFADISGIGGKMPASVGWLLLIGGLSLAGVPPLNGFISKLALIQGGVHRGDWPNLIIMVAAGILTVIYMIRAWQRIFQQKALPDTAETKSEGDSLLAPFLLICICLLLGTVLAEPLIQLTMETVRQLGDPRIYISAVNLPA